MKPRATGAPRRPSVLRLAKAGFDLLLPPSCVLCSRSVDAGAAPVCPACWHRLPGIPRPRCDRCGATRLTPAENGGCAACAAWPASVLRTAAVSRMAGCAARLVHELKYSGWTALARPMGAAMAEPARVLARRSGTPVHDLLLAPIPITPARRRERGFNQAGLLAAGLGDRLGVEVAGLLERRRASSSQVQLARRDRLANVRDQFRPSARGARCGGRPVLLVDDVVTSGATAAACVTTLANAGWQPIGLVSFARAWQTLDASGDSGASM